MTQPCRWGLPTFLHARRIASTSPCPGGAGAQGAGVGSVVHRGGPVAPLGPRGMCPPASTPAGRLEAARVAYVLHPGMHPTTPAPVQRLLTFPSL